jgi:leucyl-tRNA synthetase
VLGNEGIVIDAAFPIFDAKYVLETAKDYPVSINGKMRTNISIDLSCTEAQVSEIVLANTIVQKWMEGNPVKKLIFVKGKMINVVT